MNWDSCKLEVEKINLKLEGTTRPLFHQKTSYIIKKTATCLPGLPKPAWVQSHLFTTDRHRPSASYSCVQITFTLIHKRVRAVFCRHSPTASMHLILIIDAHARRQWLKTSLETDRRVIEIWIGWQSASWSARNNSASKHVHTHTSVHKKTRQSHTRVHTNTTKLEFFNSPCTSIKVVINPKKVTWTS